MQSIAVLITCHNRREKTIACLESLFASRGLQRVRVEVFVVNDGSTDGTGQVLRRKFPGVNVIEGDGNLYWNGGMRLALSVAMQHDFDYYMWLNDDTMLNSGALSAMLSLAMFEVQTHCNPSIVVGTTQGDLQGLATYGGLRRVSRWRPLRCTIIQPSDVAVSCDTMNGNCVLIPRAVVAKVGSLDNAFAHSMGDIDYGLRARTAGFRILVFPGYVGFCSHNQVDNTYKDTTLSFAERWKKLVGAKGLPPRQWYVFTRRHAGTLWPLLWISPYLRLLVSSIFPKRVGTE